MAQLTRTPTSARRFDAYRVALQFVQAVSPLIPLIRRHDTELAKQVQKALPSAPQNFVEAMRRVGQDRAHLLTVALGSADEVRTILDISVVRTYITAEQAHLPEQLGDRFCAMTFRIRERLTAVTAGVSSIR